ncbi:MAG: PEP/pyruvate-binding domain-containing protein [Chloroflexota bacterium]|nr:PEP/pyruvate-binding domain-containing protein [Chloroflexota bacterium]
MSLYRKLREISLDAGNQYGGKAARLGEAAQLHCPVLPGVVLSADLYHRFMRQGGLRGEVSTILATMQPTTLTHFQAAEWAIESAFRVRRVPDEVVESIRQAWWSLGGGPVAVRSSATNEDSPRQSFVGQHATYLNVDNEESLVEAVVGCWRSLFSAKALSYARHFNVDLLNSSMAVLLQPMIRPVSQGVLLTVDPITGDADVFLLEIQSGPWKGLYRLDPYLGGEGNVPFEDRLRELGLLLDEHGHGYQAIEWAVDEGDRLCFLRVRPVTKSPPYLPLRGQDVGAGRGTLELASPPDHDSRSLSPFSWYHRSRSPRLNAAYFWDVSPLFHMCADRDEFYLCGYPYERRYPFPDIMRQRWGPLKGLVYALRCLYAARGLGRDCEALDREERSRLDTLNERDLAALSPAELAEQLREVMSLHERFWAQCGKLGNVDDVLFEVLGRLHEWWLHEPLDYRDLVWSPDDRHTKAEETLCDLARAEYAHVDERERAFGSFFRTHRHLFVSDNPLATWQDICDLTVDRKTAWHRFLAWGEKSEPSLREQHVEHKAERDRRERDILRRLGRLQRVIYTQVLEMARGYGVLVSNCHDAVTLCRLMERDVVWEVGRRLYVQGAITSCASARLLSSLEILNWLEGDLATDELVRAISGREEIYRRWRRYTPPDRIEVEGRRSGEAEEVPDNALGGQAISPGVAQGSVRIVDTLGEASEVRPGDVLVCRKLLFELSPLFDVVSAVVAEQGGVLDHAAVLAREYGVPAVFGVRGATSELREGERVRVDGKRGLVVPHVPGERDYLADMKALEG